MIRPIHGGNIDWAVSIVNCPTQQILDFSASINPLGPPNSSMEAISQGLSQLKNYPNPDYTQFRQAIAQEHQLRPDSVLPANGAAELLTWVAWEAFSLQGFWLPAPCFADYKRALATFKVNYFSYSLDELEQGLNLSEAHHQALLINNPHNPSGRLWSKDTLIPYLAKFALVVVDEAFMDFLAPEQEQSLIELVSKYNNLVILRSLTKFYSLPGLRIGYGISNPTRIERWQKWRDPWSVNILAALAGTAALQDKNFRQQTWQWLSVARKKLFEQLNAFDKLQVFPSSANFFLVKSEMSVPDLQLQLLEADYILIRDCLSFPELGESYFRIAVKTEEQNQRLINSIDRILSLQ